MVANATSRDRAVDPGPGRRWRELPTTDRRVLAVVAVALAVPFVVAAVVARRAGWVPVDDTVTMVVGSRATGTADTPLLGLVSSGRKYGIPAFNPGPLPFWVNAPTVHAFGGPAGMLAGGALLSILSVWAIGYVTMRAQGARAAVGALLLVGATVVLSGGMQFFYDPAIGRSTLLPSLLALFSVWAVLAGASRVLPVAVLAVSYVAQSDIGFAVVPLALTVLTGAVLVARRVRSDGPFLPDDAGSRRAMAGSVAMAALAWWGPALETLRGDGNLSALYRASMKAVGETQGIGRALELTGRSMVGAAAANRAEDAASDTSMVVPILLTVAVAGVVVALWRWAAAPMRWALVVAGVSLAGSTAVMASLPGDESYLYLRLVPTLAALAFGWFAVALLVARARPEWSRFVPAAVRAHAGPVAIGLAVLAAVLAWVPSPVDLDSELTPSAFVAGPTLAEQVAPHLSADGSWDISNIGPVSLWKTSAVMAGELDGRGIRTGLIPRSTPLWHREVPTVGRIVVMPSLAPRPPGLTPIAEVEPEGWDRRAADDVAAEIARFVRSSGSELTPFGLQQLPLLLCPTARPDGGCDAADEVQRSADPVEELPEWLIAVAYLQQHDPDDPFTFFTAPEPPRRLLQRLEDRLRPLAIVVYR